jgi:hypothetical protein
MSVRRGLVLSAIVVAVSSAAMQPALSAARGSTITAVVVKSWGNCSSSALIWDSLNANWSNYGTIPLTIDYNHPGLCLGGDTITLDKLEGSGADVVILSDPAGNHAVYSSDEEQALSEYAAEGHDIIGTYLTFQYDGTDDRVLAPLFGVNPDQTYDVTVDAITPTYKQRDPSLPLFRAVGDPYVSSGYPFSELPADGAWSSNELTTGTLAARTSGSQAVIVLQRAGSYNTLYIAHMPEYYGSTIDEQFFYNAVVYLATR